MLSPRGQQIAGLFRALYQAGDDADALAVSIVTVASRGAASAVAVREDRPDAVVAAEAREGGTLRERLAAELSHPWRHLRLTSKDNRERAG
jgi:hypothetical protein